MTQNTILVVDDDKEIRDLLTKYLTQYGNKVLTAKDGKEMFTIFASHKIDIILLDIMLPGDSGVTLCQQLRKISNVPIIMLTAVNEDIERVVGLESGADDYQTKPFNPRELLARIKAILRRTTEFTSIVDEYKTYIFANWKLDTATRKFLSPENMEVTLSAGEYDLLLVFLEKPQRIISRDKLLDLTRNRPLDPFDRSIDVQVNRLRQKIETDTKNPQIIKTIRGGGYMLAAEVIIKKDY